MLAMTLSSAPEVILVGLPLGTNDEAVTILPHRLLDRVFFVIVLDLAVADGGRAIVDHGEPRRTQRLALAALFQRTDGGGELRWSKMFVNMY